MRPLDDDQFSAMLKDRADEVVGDIQLDHPGMSEELPIPGFSPEDAPSPSTRRTWWLGMAAALLLVVAGGVYLMVGGDDSLPVTTPADGEPDAADLGPIPDPATSSPEEVVRAAIERTSAVSWTAEQSKGEEQIGQVLYNPASGSEDWVVMTSTDGEFLVPRPERTEFDQPRSIFFGDGLSLGECLNEAPPCSYGKWYSSDSPYPESAMFPLLGSLDPASAEERGEGVYAVRQTDWPGTVDSPSSVAMVHIRDGFLRRIIATSASERAPGRADSVVEFSEIGNAPEVTVPPESNIVELDPDPQTVTPKGGNPDCSVLVVLSPESATVTPQSGLPIENEVMFQVLGDGDASSIDELLQRARDTGLVDSVTGPRVGGCDPAQVLIHVIGPEDTVSQGPG